MGSAASANLRAFSGRAGARVGFGAGVGGSLYAHVGYGTAGTGGEVDFRQNGLSYDAGLSLDVTFIPFINFGLHGGFNSLLPSGDPNADPINWIDVGLHVELVF